MYPRLDLLPLQTLWIFRAHFLISKYSSLWFLETQKLLHHDSIFIIADLTLAARLFICKCVLYVCCIRVVAVFISKNWALNRFEACNERQCAWIVIAAFLICLYSCWHCREVIVARYRVWTTTAAARNDLYAIFWRRAIRIDLNHRCIRITDCLKILKFPVCFFKARFSRNTLWIVTAALYFLRYSSRASFPNTLALKHCWRQIVAFFNSWNRCLSLLPSLAWRHQHWIAVAALFLSFPRQCLWITLAAHVSCLISKINHQQNQYSKSMIITAIVKIHLLNQTSLISANMWLNAFWLVRASQNWLRCSIITQASSIFKLP